MTDLATFLLARVAEDEQIARDAGSGHWSWKQGFGELCNDPECPFGSLVSEGGSDHPLVQLMDVHGYDVHDGWQGAAQIARWDPARVLAECNAKRRIVERLARYLDTHYGDDFSGRESAEETLGFLAQAYADHPDYRSEWTP